MKFRAKRPKSQGITASYHPAAVPHIRPNDGSLGCSTKVFLFTTKRPARQSRNQNSEYLAQRRKGRKEIKPADLAFLASWREQIPVLDSPHGPLESLRKLRKSSSTTKDTKNGPD